MKDASAAEALAAPIPREYHPGVLSGLRGLRLNCHCINRVQFTVATVLGVKSHQACNDGTSTIDHLSPLFLVARIVGSAAHRIQILAKLCPKRRLEGVGSFLRIKFDVYVFWIPGAALNSRSVLQRQSSIAIRPEIQIIVAIQTSTFPAYRARVGSSGPINMSLDAVRP